MNTEIKLTLDPEVVALLRDLLATLTQPDEKLAQRLRTAEGRIGTLRRDVDALLDEGVDE